MRFDPLELEIRTAVPSEATAVSDLLTEAAEWIPEVHEPLWSADQVAVERVAPDCEAGLFVVAWSGLTALGTMRIADVDPDFWPNANPGEAIYIHRLAVRRVAAGGGVSSALLRHAAQIATARGARFLRLDCESSRPRLRALYERFGFKFHSYRLVRGVHVARYQLPMHDA